MLDRDNLFARDGTCFVDLPHEHTICARHRALGSEGPTFSLVPCFHCLEILNSFEQGTLQFHFCTRPRIYVVDSGCVCVFLVTQSCPTLCDPMDCSPPGSSVHGISQASMLKWVAIPFSRRSSQCRGQTQVSCTAGGFFTSESPGKPSCFWILLLLSRVSRVWLCATPEMAAHQAPPSLGFSRQEHWSGLPFPSPMHESEKSKWSRSVVSDSLRPHGLQPTRLLHPWDLPGKSTGVGCHCLLQKHSAKMPQRGRALLIFTTSMNFKDIS